MAPAAPAGKCPADDSPHLDRADRSDPHTSRPFPFGAMDAANERYDAAKCRHWRTTVTGEPIELERARAEMDEAGGERYKARAEAVEQFVGLLRLAVDDCPEAVGALLVRALATQAPYDELDADLDALMIGLEQLKRRKAVAA